MFKFIKLNFVSTFIKLLINYNLLTTFRVIFWLLCNAFMCFYLLFKIFFNAFRTLNETHMLIDSVRSLAYDCF